MGLSRPNLDGRDRGVQEDVAVVVRDAAAVPVENDDHRIEGVRAKDEVMHARLLGAEDVFAIPGGGVLVGERIGRSQRRLDGLPDAELGHRCLDRRRRPRRRSAAPRGRTGTPAEGEHERTCRDRGEQHDDEEDLADGSTG